MHALTLTHERVHNGYQVYNVGTGSSHSVREVVALFDDILDRDIKIVQDDDRVREADRPNLQADIEHIERELEWRPQVDFRAGIAEHLRREGLQ